MSKRRQELQRELNSIGYKMLSKEETAEDCTRSEQIQKEMAALPITARERKLAIDAGGSGD